MFHCPLIFLYCQLNGIDSMGNDQLRWVAQNNLTSRNDLGSLQERVKNWD
jgi:hypothetical protein